MQVLNEKDNRAALGRVVNNETTFDYVDDAMSAGRCAGKRGDSSKVVVLSRRCSVILRLRRTILRKSE